MRKLLLWLVMVAAMVAAILGGTAAFLYSRTGEDRLPQQPVQFGGLTLTANGWDWAIPVLGDKVSKTYESPTNLTVQKLGTFTDTIPALTLPEWVTAAEVQITAPDGTVWSGGLTDCNTYTYTQNGAYQIIVTAHHSDSDAPGDPVGWYAYRAGYTMAMNPKVTLSSERAPQGSIVAIQLSGILDGEPTVESDLGEVWFRKTATGYMGYLPVTYNAEGGDHTLQLTCGTLQKEITLTVTRTLYDTVSVPAEEDVGGGEEFRNAIWPLYTTGSSAKLWNGRFEAPSAGAVSLAYGTTQMVDGQRSGQATGLTYAAADGETVTAPQAGNIVFAGTLTLTGGTVVSSDLGYELKDATVQMLGHARQVKVTKENTTIVGGAGDKDAIAARIAQIRSQIEAATSDFDREKLQERLAKLAGGVAVIKVGAATEVEMKDKKLRIEDALNATKAAVQEGVVAGGGTAPINAIPAVRELCDTLEGDERTGAKIVLKALEAPLRQIAKNAGLEGSVIIDKIISANKPNYGFDAQNEVFVDDMIAAGIVDPTKVTRSALENAASVAEMVLTTESLVADLPEPPAAPAAAGGDMGGMGGMY